MKACDAGRVARMRSGDPSQALPALQGMSFEELAQPAFMEAVIELLRVDDVPIDEPASVPAIDTSGRIRRARTRRAVAAACDRH
jgi:hypothetical protein